MIRRSAATALALTLPGAVAPAAAATPHVLILSIDGMHAFDLARYARLNPSSAMAALLGHGYHYTQTSTARPADSFPGGLAIFTGGSPASTGVYFDTSYDRTLWPAGVTSGPIGAVILWDDSLDINNLAIDGGGGLDLAKLPHDPARGGAVVYPHDYLRVNTLFEVAKAAGLHTAWCDKHLADEIVNGPSGNGVDDLYTPE
ncbi:MAG TPA: alkaline phosphatase family protein, partial [Verrucomicrobiales bacterium]|nr:alkaline phosphatase family protein [Verrucomicrobiales bacterium]